MKGAVHGVATTTASTPVKKERARPSPRTSPCPSLGNIQTESIEKVTISKTLLPNQDSAGSGGLVEIETKSPLDRKRRFASVAQLRDGTPRGEFEKLEAQAEPELDLVTVDVGTDASASVADAAIVRITIFEARVALRAEDVQLLLDAGADAVAVALGPRLVDRRAVVIADVDRAVGVAGLGIDERARTGGEA